jgi:ComF family protein
MRSPLVSSLLDFIFPPLCHCCHTFIPDAGAIHICAECRTGMAPVSSPLCLQCGIPFSGAGNDHRCGACLKNPPAFTSARAPFIYQGAIAEMLHRFKYTPKPHLRRPLALLTTEALAGYLSDTKAEVVIPVPLHKKRLRQRGFNQAILLGELLAKQQQIPLERSVLQRIRWTEPQVNLSASERHSNVRGAFAVRESSRLNGKRVLLADDVFTTGSTLNECAKTLVAAGAEAVHCITVARAV